MMNPAIISTISGTYIVDGSHWVPIKSETTHEEAILIHKNLYPKHYEPRVAPPSPRQVQVKSASSGKVYTVTITPYGYKTCTCVGYSYRRSCKHITEVK